MGTRETILATARAMAQAHGYGGLNFRELAAAIGIKSASVHYHFSTKAELGVVLARRYTDDALAILETCLAEPSPDDCLRRYTDLFRLALGNGNRMCLCGYLAAEHEDLPEALRTEVRRFADVNIDWLTRVLVLREPTRLPAALRRRAEAIYAAVSGTQLAARSRNDVGVYDALVATYRDLGLIPHTAEGDSPPAGRD